MRGRNWIGVFGSVWRVMRGYGIWGWEDAWSGRDWWGGGGVWSAEVAEGGEELEFWGGEWGVMYLYQIFF